MSAVAEMIAKDARENLGGLDVVSVGSVFPPTSVDWHTLLEFCGPVNYLIIDEDGVYDARLANDRPLLGMKETMSKMELSLFRQRPLEPGTIVAVSATSRVPDRLGSDYLSARCAGRGERAPASTAARL